MLAHKEWIIKPVWSVKLLGPHGKGQIATVFSTEEKKNKGRFVEKSQSPGNTDILCDAHQLSGALAISMVRQLCHRGLCLPPLL